MENDSKVILANAAVDDSPVWLPYEISYTAEKNYAWNDFPLQVAFTYEDQQTQFTLDGYWCGDHEWRVRFAPTKPGRWTWKTVSSTGDAGLETPQGSITCKGPEVSQIETNPNFRGHLRISANQRHFEYADRTPFFWIGDTNWPLNTLRCGLRPDDPDHDGYAEGAFYAYVKNRKAKGFTVIQTSLWRSYLGSPQRNEGGYPFPRNTYDASGNPEDNKDFSVLNPDYFDYLDRRIVYVWEQGFVISGHPNWIGRHVAMNLEQAGALERYILARYGAFNLVYSISGEYQRGMQADLGDPIPQGKRWTVEDYRQLGEATARYNAYEHPLTIHPDSPHTSSEDFHKESWLSHNWTQVGGGEKKSGLYRIAQLISHDYQLIPMKPVVHSEGQYEGNYMSYLSQEGDDDICTADVVRFEAWAAFMSGACGHTYGSNGIWQFYDPYDTSGDKWRDDMDVQPWWNCLDHEGAGDMIHIREFFEKVGLQGWMKLEPGREKLQINGTVPDENAWYDPYCLSSPEQIVIYIPAGNQGKMIEITELHQATFKGTWFNPRNGMKIPLDNSPVGLDSWEIPGRPDDQDWVLYLWR